jgi:hypothetical protein
LESLLYGQSWWEALMISSPTWWKPKHCEFIMELKALHLYEVHCMATFLFHAFSFAISLLETKVSCDIFCCKLQFVKGWLQYEMINKMSAQTNRKECYQMNDRASSS